MTTAALKVAYDAGPLLHPATGVGRYTAELAAALEVLGVEVKRYAFAFRGAPPHDVARMRVPGRVARAAWKRFDRPVVQRLTGGVSVVHGTNFVLPALGGAPGVVTVHDLSFLRDDVYPGGEGLREAVPWSLGRASQVIVPTQAIRVELQERYATPEERVCVTSEGVSERFFGATPLSEAALGGLGIPGPFALAVGTLEPRKNLARLIEAWQLASSSLSGWRLVLAGPTGWGPELPETAGVMPIGRVPDEMLPGLMAAAGIFCYPSLYEGFGLPPLEAMATKTAVLAGRYPAADEVLGEGALLVDPFDIDAMAAGLVRLSDPAEARALAFTGRAQAARFTWLDTARRTLGAYRAAIEG
ncbi:MAG: glycosyltransferase family 4 protein [Actinomycetota bacterium]